MQYTFSIAGASLNLYQFLIIQTMSTKTGEAMRQLRKIIHLTQGEFAALVGASKDAVASWEVGRNPLSPPFARRISMATGVDEEDLLRGRLPLRTSVFSPGRQPVTAETFAQHRQSYWGATDGVAARRHLKNGADALGLLLSAAAGTPDGKSSCLPAVVDSFVQWCQQTRQDFQLEPAINRLLDERKSAVTVSQSYEAWRRQQREDPAACRMMGFKDNPKKGDHENLSLTAETVPAWRPGYPMGGGR